MKGENATEIERIYVLKEFQGRHAGQILYEKAPGEAKKSSTGYVWLGVWEKNPKRSASTGKTVLRSLTGIFSGSAMMNRQT
jgi:ribosomal protein S18 acetylase RimI-like enzyme